MMLGRLEVLGFGLRTGTVLWLKTAKDSPSKIRQMVLLLNIYDEPIEEIKQLVRGTLVLCYSVPSVFLRMHPKTNTDTKLTTSSRNNTMITG